MASSLPFDPLNIYNNTSDSSNSDWSDSDGNDDTNGQPIDLSSIMPNNVDLSSITEHIINQIPINSSSLMNLFPNIIDQMSNDFDLSSIIGLIPPDQIPNNFADIFDSSLKFFDTNSAKIIPSPEGCEVSHAMQQTIFDLIRSETMRPIIDIIKNIIKSHNFSDHIRKFVNSKFHDIPPDFRTLLNTNLVNFIKSTAPITQSAMQQYFDNKTTVLATLKNSILCLYHNAPLNDKVFFPCSYHLENICNSIVNNPELILELDRVIDTEMSIQYECEKSAARIQAAWRGYKFRKEHLHNPHDKIGKKFLMKRAIWDCLDCNLAFYSKISRTK